MVRGVGVDVIEIGRFEKALARRPGLYRRLFTPEEVASCARKGRPAASLAARFAAKEAVKKAFFQAGGRAVLRWREVEVGGGAGGPEVWLRGRAAAAFRELGVTHLFLSLSHSADYACAFAVAWGESSPGGGMGDAPRHRGRDAGDRPAGDA